MQSPTCARVGALEPMPQGFWSRPERDSCWLSTRDADGSPDIVIYPDVNCIPKVLRQVSAVFRNCKAPDELLEVEFDREFARLVLLPGKRRFHKYAFAD